MSTSKPRVDLAVGVFLLLAFITLMVLAISSTNGRLPVIDDAGYKVTARFSNISELRVRAPVKIGGVRVGEIADIQLDPQTFEAVVTLALRRSAGEIPNDSSAGVFTAGLLGDRYIGITPGGDPEPLSDGDEMLLTQSAVVLEELISKFIFGSTDDKKSDSDDASKETSP
ncbi:MAG: outer membrane lipid asymmetry maintenance protein MlaD [Xanthomonadaceae bacterium]|nr:outer membrane lipid asymmetry maintenance protein MlaD [Xanthomonadaceae bacterium]MDP2186966.1 outer membrane lipid asymmetry maintenance protein MlaD [Xanthomonadales bacterium]MDZ4116741.1 outer membrane lipid asymmetry maintenance protein MlaD [Xanthomonadaceae bacterium]MDZ4379393.1 outer membrane lipid asymmetry maintenance protein MlaD [Xanthomonadaceae bacterium]